MGAEFRTRRESGSEFYPEPGRGRLRFFGFFVADPAGAGAVSSVTGLAEAGYKNQERPKA